MDKVNFVKIAKSLLQAEQKTELAQRYLSIRRRQRVIAHALREQIELARAASPLVGMVGPLSVSGVTDHAVLARAEWLNKQGIIVSMALDSKGRHCGTGIDEIASHLRLTYMQVMDAYELWSSPQALAGADPVMAKLLARENRLVILRRFLEADLTGRKKSYRFSAVISKETVQAVLATIPKTPSLVLSYSSCSGLLIAGKAVDTGWGLGGGLAVIARSDLVGVLAKAEVALTIECFEDFWTAWPDSGPAGAPEGFKQRVFEFRYYNAHVE